MWKQAAGHYVAQEAAAAMESKPLRPVPMKPSLEKAGSIPAKGTPSTRATRGRQKDEQKGQQQVKLEEEQQQQQLANGNAEKAAPPGRV